MNCKPGDLALIVKSVAGHEGKVIRVIRYVGYVDGWIGEDRWETDTILKGKRGELTNTFRDSCLRPIRPDETTEQSIEAMKLLHQLPKETV